MKMSYDAVNKIVAYDQSLSTNNFAFNQRIVADYKNVSTVLNFCYLKNAMLTIYKNCKKDNEKRLFQQSFT